MQKAGIRLVFRVCFFTSVFTTVFDHFVRINVVHPLAAQLDKNFYWGEISDEPVKGYITESIELERQAHHQAGFEPMISRTQGMSSTAELQPQPDLIAQYRARKRELRTSVSCALKKVEASRLHLHSLQLRQYLWKRPCFVGTFSASKTRPLQLIRGETKLNIDC